jgi:predicted TPR repeat methyltransferase
VGCGLAHYADYLERRYDDIRYTGIDLSSAMIELAGRRRSDLDLRVANLLDIQDGLSYDVVNANGIFYLLGDEAPDLVPRLVERMWSLARVAMAFNSLSAWAPSRDPNEYQAHPLETAEMCRQFSPRIVLRHDYMPHDFTIYVYRGGHG